VLVFREGRTAGCERIPGMKLYVGNLSYAVNDTSLRGLFEAYGTVQSATVVVDRDSGRSKGFGFVEMGDEDAKKAMQALNGSQHEGRTIRVNEARPKNP
jgi:RNA recognition motif-containing protein